MASVVVIGANGYVGFGVAQYLRIKGFKVYGVIRKIEQAHKLAVNEIIPIIGDAGKVETFIDVLQKVQIVIDATFDMTMTANNNHTVLEATKKLSPHGKKIFIFTSGILVHGDHDHIVTEDEVNPHPTFIDRANFEKTVTHSTEVYGIVIRPGFVYGYAGGNPGQHTDAIFKLKENQGKIVIQGNKDRRHSWIHISDLSHAYYLAIQQYTVASGQIFDIATPEAPIYEEIYKKGAAIAGHKSAEVVVHAFPPENTWGSIINQNVRVSYQKAQNLLGFTPLHLNILDDLEPVYEAYKAITGKN